LGADQLDQRRSRRYRARTRLAEHFQVLRAHAKQRRADKTVRSRRGDPDATVWPAVERDLAAGHRGARHEVHWRTADEPCDEGVGPAVVELGWRRGSLAHALAPYRVQGG